MNFHDFIRDSEGWQTLSRELQYENPYLQVYRTETRTPDSARMADV